MTFPDTQYDEAEAVTADLEAQAEAKVRQAFRVIIKNRNAKALNYAVNYAHAGLGMIGHELRIQCLYVLNNMTHWRGEEAKEVRKTLKEFSR